MNGTLDQLDTFFGSITGVWGRVLSFFVTCWLGFFIGILAAATRWTWDDWLQFQFTLGDWYYVPISWMFFSVFTCLHWWGCVHFLFLLILGFAVFFRETSLCQALCALLLVECWYWWFVVYFTYSIDGDPLDIIRNWKVWHPVLILMMYLSAALVWLWSRSWRNDHGWIPGHNT